MRNYKLLFVIFVILSAATGFSCCAGANETTQLIAQDEMFFSQQEKFRQLQAEFDAEHAVLQEERKEKDVLLAKYNAVLNEKDLLLVRFDDLQKGTLAREQDLKQEKIDTLSSALQMQSLFLEQKKLQFEQMRIMKDQLTVGFERLTKEKIVLQKELDRVTGELGSVKANIEKRIDEERVGCEQKVSDLQSRLNAEQTLVNEKIGAKTASLAKELKASQDQNMRGKAGTCDCPTGSGTGKK